MTTLPSIRSAAYLAITLHFLRMISRKSAMLSPELAGKDDDFMVYCIPNDSVGMHIALAVVYGPRSKSDRETFFRKLDGAVDALQVNLDSSQVTYSRYYNFYNIFAKPMYRGYLSSNSKYMLSTHQKTQEAVRFAVDRVLHCHLGKSAYFLL